MRSKLRQYWDASAQWFGMLAMMVATGCVSGQNVYPGSLGEMITPLMPKSPGQIARDARDGLVNNDPDKIRRSIALLSSASWGGEEAYLALYRLVSQYPDDTVQTTGIRALGRHGTPDDVPLIVIKLKRGADYVRWEAARSLQRIHNPVAINPLIATTKRVDEQVDVRLAAIGALGQYPKSEVFDALVGALNDRHFAVRHSAQKSLKILTGQRFGPDTGTWLSWRKKNQDSLFKLGQTYVWQPYSKPPTFWDKAKFWKKRRSIPPRRPTGAADL